MWEKSVFALDARKDFYCMSLLVDFGVRAGVCCGCLDCISWVEVLSSKQLLLSSNIEH